MNSPKIFYNPIDGSAPLSIYYFDGAKGNAIEADFGDGVGFFGPSQDFLGVIFDNVSDQNDEQELFFSNGAKIKIRVHLNKIEIIELVKPKKQDSA